MDVFTRRIEEFSCRQNVRWLAGGWLVITRWRTGTSDEAGGPLREESVHVPRILEAGRIRSVSLITRAPLNPMPRTRANESAVLLEHDRSFASSRFQRLVPRINGDLVRILIYDDKV